MKRTELESIKDYYSRVIKSSADLSSGACCSAEALPPLAREAHKLLHPEITGSFYGCGSPIPAAIEGCTVLDLGCGTGRDSYLCAKLVGESGRVIGLDMTEAQLEVARRHGAYQTQQFGYQHNNSDFRRGYIEDLAAADIADASVDVVISNCVINLSPDKARVFAEVMRVLKPGGEFYFSDVFADRRLSPSLREDQLLLGECLAGALYLEDFRRMMLELGVADTRTVSCRASRLGNPMIEAKIGPTRFFSVTVRAFKIPSLEDRCEDYGQVAWYKGTIPGYPHAYALDDHHEFFSGKAMLVCANTAAMLEETRLAPHFRIDGNRSTHFGLFPCGPESSSAPESCDAGGCC